ncbi:hypothetical protein [Streptomyces sp. NPDC006638]|uniref:DUF6907 domain-containing protein n=1 Tax=Streptomyces sp. NPDC006638 TaxID=3157183 RepID=UPI0033AF8ABF
MNALRTITLQTLDHGPITITCPAWCTGHPGPPEFRVDTTHSGPSHVGTFRGRELQSARLAHSPFATRPGGDLAVSVGEPVMLGLDPAGLDELAAAYVAYAVRLRHLARELAVLLARGDGR